MNQQETQEYWHHLENYNTESERNLRRGEVADGHGRPRALPSPVQYRNDRVFDSAGEDCPWNARVSQARHGEEVMRQHLDNLSPKTRRSRFLEMECEQREQVGMKKGNVVGRFFSSFACRPGAVTPEDAAVPVNDSAPAGMVSIVPKKYAMAYHSRRIGRPQQEEEDTRLGERLLALQLSAPNDKRTQDIEDNRRATEDAQQVSRASKRSENTQRRSKPRVVNVESQTQSVIGPPVDLSKMIQRAPDSIRTPFPLPGSEVGPSGIREGVHRARQETHSGSSLSDRLRQTKLEDLPLRFGAAEEIRNLMLDLERDQNVPTNTPIQHSVGHPDAIDPTNTPASQPNELPGGFSRLGTVSPCPIANSIPTSGLTNLYQTTTPPQFSTSPSFFPRETLERHFRTQRQVNERFALQVKAAKSHSSNLTLPPSFRVPEMHSSVLSIPREPSPLAQVASAEDFGATNLGEEDVDCVDHCGMDRGNENEQADIEDLE
jgi:hypothetical protein